MSYSEYAWIRSERRTVNQSRSTTHDWSQYYDGRSWDIIGGSSSRDLYSRIPADILQYRQPRSYGETYPTRRDSAYQDYLSERPSQGLTDSMGNIIIQISQRSERLVKITDPCVRTVGEPAQERNVNTDSMENSAGNENQVHEATACSSCDGNTLDVDHKQRPTRFSDGAFVGLMNTGNSCCINVLLQTLFMTPEYRNFLSRCRQEGFLKNARDHILYQLDEMFQKLQNSGARRITSPLQFIHCLRLNHINIGIQMDAEELFRSLFCLVQNQLKGTDLITDMNEIYIITTEEYTKCIECQQEIKLIGNMLTLPLSIYDPSTGTPLKNIENSLANFFEPQRLDAGNMCYCEQCGRKTVTMKSYGKILYPQILCLQMKRFSSNCGKTIKNYDFMEFPESLNLAKFGDESHSERNKFQYHLMSVIVHMGSAIFGHYYAYIRTFPEMCWYSFMDEYVSKATWEGVKSTFGSSRRYSGRSGLQMEGTAYLLFYRRMDVSQNAAE
ncbi:ubl carboxyl-terminal hydrolase 18-like [Amblyraja radiata]|uniref:ubl carboxyl-terminal hydrolase 18-like n=1 Tax=Amblyraja radiata TaxID=386614 RepID=UPI0014040C7C|nr:ubl carboxyl-terminal hydrolase 18-like [Amblyraja radiata]